MHAASRTMGQTTGFALSRDHHQSWPVPMVVVCPRLLKSAKQREG
jgi:hypothetical protein